MGESATHERDALVGLLGSDDSQVRLNAAVRLAYLTDASGLSVLVEGLSADPYAIRFAQVPEALAELGELCVPLVRRQAHTPGPARVPAARTLALCGHGREAVSILDAALRTEDVVEQAMAVALAGEIGSAAGELQEPLTAAAMRCAPFGVGALSALVSVIGERGLPTVMATLADPSATVRRDATRALACLGQPGAAAAEQLAAALADATLSLRERLDASEAFIQVAPADTAARTLVDALGEDNRWLQVGLLRHLARLGARCFVPAGASGSWPQWQADLLHRTPPPMDPWSQSSVVSAIADLVIHDDYDLRRNVLLVLALCRPTSDVLDIVGRATQVEPRLRAEVRHFLGDTAEPMPAADPFALPLTAPDYHADGIASDCEAMWALADGGDLAYNSKLPKWQFLQYLVDTRGFMLHGSRTAGLVELRPINQSATGTRTASQPGVFAVDDALMAMYFGIVDRTQLPNMSNAIYSLPDAGGNLRRCYHLGAEFIGLAARPFIPATVYVLPRDTFAMDGEWTSIVPVQPLARVAVAPEDFPLLEHLWGSDLSGLDAQFSDEQPFLRDLGRWATRRSDRSGCEP